MCKVFWKTAAYGTLIFMKPNLHYAKIHVFSHADKIRLLLIYIISQEGLPDAERQRLFDLARLGREEYQALTNLSLLGVRLSASLDKRRNDEIKSNPYSLSVLRSTRKRTKPADYENSRHIPAAKFIVEVRLPFSAAMKHANSFSGPIEKLAQPFFFPLD
jgi:hypothetical protein